MELSFYGTSTQMKQEAQGQSSSMGLLMTQPPYESRLFPSFAPASSS